MNFITTKNVMKWSESVCIEIAQDSISSYCTAANDTELYLPGVVLSSAFRIVCRALSYSAFFWRGVEKRAERSQSRSRGVGGLALNIM